MTWACAVLGIALLACGSDPATAIETEANGGAGVVIPPNDQHQPLNFSFSAENGKVLRFELSENGGRCYLDGQDLNLVAPCDVRTKLAAAGFAIDNRYDPTAGVRIPANKIVFEIIGDVRFQPRLRAFCGVTGQQVTMTWPSKNKQKDLPHKIDLHPLDYSGRIICTRSYEFIK